MVPVLGVLALALAPQAGPITPQGSVAGVVRDAETGEALAGAVVALSDLDRAVATDERGAYAFPSVPPGPQHLVVRRLGYRPRTLHLLVPRSGRVEVDVSLRTRPIELGEIRVTPTRPVRGLDPSDGAAAFPDRGITQPALRNHPTLAQADALEALAGGEVILGPEAPTGVHIRGGASDHTAYLLDDVPVLNPYHAAGLFSAWNPDALAALDVVGAAPSPALPDALAGTITARTREPGPAHHVQGALSNTEARLTADGPAPGGVAYLLGWRAGLAGAFTPRGEGSYLGAETGDLIGTLAAPALGGRLRLLLYDAENEIGAASVVPEDGDPTPTPRNAFDWTSTSYGAAWARRSPSSVVRVGVWRARSDVGSRWHPEESAARLESDRADLGANGTVQVRSARSTTEAGLRFRRIATTYRIATGSDSTAWDARGAANVVTAFADHSRRLAPSVETWVGASASVSGGEARVAPRFRVRWRPDDRLALTGAYSRTVQFAQSLRNPESVVGHIFPADLFLGAGVAGVPVPEGDQVVLAAELRPSPGVRVGVQGFGRRMRDLLLVAPVESGPFATSGFVVGESTARGASLELAASGARYGLVASYGIQRVRLAARDSAYTPRHGIGHTVDAGVIVFPTATSAIRLAVFATAGRRATSNSGPLEWETCNVVDQGCEFAGSPTLDGPPGGARLPAYARIDLGARKHWHAHAGGRDVLIGLFATVANVLGAPNTLAYTVDPETGQRLDIRMLPRTPLIVGLDTRF